MRQSLHFQIEAIAGAAAPALQSTALESADTELLQDDMRSRVAIHAHHTATFLFACAKASLALRLRSLEHIVASVRRRKAAAMRGGAAFDHARNRELVAVFNRLSPLVFEPRNPTLFDSLALIEFLALHQSFPSWVWGVTRQPLCAHSWVQQEGCVFNRPVEYVLRFTPILAI